MKFILSNPASSECRILSANPSSATSILVKWEKYPGGTSYLLDLRKINSTDTAPVVISAGSQTTELNVHGLSPGREYKVTLKVFAFYFVECVASTTASTGNFNVSFKQKNNALALICTAPP